MKRLYYYNPLLMHDDFLSIPFNQHTILIINNNNNNYSFVRICCSAWKNLCRWRLLYNNISGLYCLVDSGACWFYQFLSTKQLYKITTEAGAVLEFDAHFLKTFAGEGCPVTMCWRWRTILNKWLIVNNELCVWYLDLNRVLNWGEFKDVIVCYTYLHRNYLD